jgi:hypothetical protein
VITIFGWDLPKRPSTQNRFHWNYVYFWDYAGGMMTAGEFIMSMSHWALGQDAPLMVSAGGGSFAERRKRNT